MIIDHLEHQAQYPFGRLWDTAFEFLKTVTPETACGKYPLEGDALIAIVDGYETKPRNSAKLETHRKYADIQIMISGEEAHEIFPEEGLTVSTPYIPERDVEFYQIPKESGIRLVMRPGDFAVYFPQDAHMPCLMTGSAPQLIKKVVFKIVVDSMEKN